MFQRFLSEIIKQKNPKKQTKKITFKKLTFIYFENPLCISDDPLQVNELFPSKQKDPNQNK